MKSRPQTATPYGRRRLLQIPRLGLFHLKDFRCKFEWKRRLDQEFEATVPETRSAERRRVFRP